MLWKSKNSSLQLIDRRFGVKNPMCKAQDRNSQVGTGDQSGLAAPLAKAEHETTTEHSSLHTVIHYMYRYCI